MNASWLKRGVKLAGAFILAAAVSGCIIAPYPPHYGYYRPHPYGYY